MDIRLVCHETTSGLLMKHILRCYNSFNPLFLVLVSNPKPVYGVALHLNGVKYKSHLTAWWVCYLWACLRSVMTIFHYGAKWYQSESHQCSGPAMKLGWSVLMPNPWLYWQSGAVIGSNMCRNDKLEKVNRYMGLCWWLPINVTDAFQLTKPKLCSEHRYI